MRIKIKSHKEAEELEKKFEECHIENIDRHLYLVVDKAKKKAEAY